MGLSVLIHVASNAHIVCTWVSAYQEYMLSLATGWTHGHGAAAASSISQRSRSSASPSTLNLMEILAEALFQLSRDEDCVPRRLPLQASLSTFTISHATCGEVSGYLWLCIFSRRLVHPPLVNCGLYGNGMMVACQLSLNHSYHQTGLKIK